MTNLDLFVENGKKIIGVAANYRYDIIFEFV